LLTQSAASGWKPGGAVAGSQSSAVAGS